MTKTSEIVLIEEHHLHTPKVKVGRDSMTGKMVILGYVNRKEPNCPICQSIEKING